MRCRGRSLARPASRASLWVGFSLLLWSVPAAAQPTFDGVGDLAGGAATSSALAVSADGSTVVGASESGLGPEAFRWTGPGSITGLGALDSGADFDSTAQGVSGDGGVIVGTSLDGGDFSGFRWTSGGGMQALGRLGCGFICPGNPASAASVSEDGLVAVGSGASGFVDTTIQAVRWTGGGTSIDGLGHLSGGGDASIAQGASSNGAILVGDSDSSGGSQGFWWNGSLHALGGVAGADLASTAIAISADASTIVGGANIEVGTTAAVAAVRWTGASYATIERLGALPGALERGRARAVNGDGSVIVGVARNADSDNVAFIWDAVHGIRELKDVLISDYGLAIDDWTLSEARGVSDPDLDGGFTVVGTGINPSGDTEGWVAYLYPVACSDGIDNDSDGDIDFPDDDGCRFLADLTEERDCSDGVDNDGDGDIDYPADGECTDANDASEIPDCGDGYDNDGDGFSDAGADPGCRDTLGSIENPACNDGVDNDGDGKVDFPFDLQCVAADDAAEIPACSDGLDNDGDGQTDLADADCSGAADLAEDPACDDRLDNDGDLRADYPDAFPACTSASDTTEAPQCSDGVDNDSDGQTDYPNDLQCVSAGSASEAPGTLALGEVLVADARGARLLALDPATGIFRELTASLQLSSPQGVVQRATGEVVLADPGGLVDVDPISGAQRRASSALDAFESLQVVFDAAGDARVLERDRISTVDWHFLVQGTPTVLFPVPSPDANLGAFTGFSLAQESDGKLLVTGIGLLGSGVWRVDPVAQTSAPVTPGFNPYAFTDLALEASGQIIAVGEVIGTGIGVFRVDPVSGAVSTISAGAPWTAPTGVAVAANGDLFVGDAGTCTEAGCSGGEVVRVDPASGTRLDVWTDPLLEGELDVAVVSVLPACSNGVDDDLDGNADYPLDGSCTGPWHVSELSACSDGLDNDGDGFADFGADVGCASAASNLENPDCDDGIDNDGDDRIDWDGGGLGAADPDCVATPSRNSEKKKKKKCGLGLELALLLPALRRLRRRRTAV